MIQSCAHPDSSLSLLLWLSTLDWQPAKGRSTSLSQMLARGAWDKMNSWTAHQQDTSAAVTPARAFLPVQCPHIQCRSSSRWLQHDSQVYHISLHLASIACIACFDPTVWSYMHCHVSMSSSTCLEQAEKAMYKASKYAQRAHIWLLLAFLRGRLTYLCSRGDIG